MLDESIITHSFRPSLFTSPMSIPLNSVPNSWLIQKLFLSGTGGGVKESGLIGMAVEVPFLPVFMPAMIAFSRASCKDDCSGAGEGAAVGVVTPETPPVM